MEPAHITLGECHAIAMEVLTRHGCDEANARAVADTIAAAERDHAYSHGLFRLPGYVTSLKNGKVNGKARPTVERLAPTVVRIHGDRGYAPLALEIGRAPLIEAAREFGMAALAVTRIHHFAALWPETSALAEEGLAAFAFTSSPPYLAAAGGRTKFFGTNPMSFAWPRKGRAPMAFDQASAAMARGEIQIHLRDGKTVPDGVGLDPEGNPTNDPVAILEGAQLPFGGYKGSAIALMVDLLAGPLIGEVTSIEAGDVDNGDGGAATGGELILALDPARFGGDDPIAHGERLFERMLAQEGVRLPGDRRLIARAETPENGIDVPTSLWETIDALRAA
ncbi:MAG: Ldh family oxidoreductase [Paracoccaceae bacterium]|nr:Ldh family oxidoreductase [Paracoccaceae bacterium]